MLHNSNKEKAVKLDMNLKNHFAGDVCAAVKSRGVGKDRAGGRGRAGDTSAAATNFGPPICSRQKHAREEEGRLKTRGVTTPGEARSPGELSTLI